MKHIIMDVEKGGILAQMGVEPGDALLEINGSKIKDIFDYRFLSADEYVEVLIRKRSGEQWLLEIEKDEGEELGGLFSEPLMDKPRACANSCIFCFIDQLPQGMRETLYFKDDDVRLSFLEGNYVTLTNIGGKELDRLIYYRLSPINVSVHTTNPALRSRMLRNRNAGKVIGQLKRMSDAGIEINCQIVLVRGVNDGGELIRTIRDLGAITGVRSVSAVPVGLTGHRGKLTALDSFDGIASAEVLDIIHAEQKRAVKERGSRFVYAADELYLKAGAEFPKYRDYDGFPQLENGVGMTVLFEREFTRGLAKRKCDGVRRSAAIVTGKIAAPLIEKLSKKFAEKFTNTEIKVIMVENRFFGEEITVSGLLTGRDIIAALREKNITGRVLLPSSCLRADTDVFLDNVRVGDLNSRLGINAVSVPADGRGLINALIAAKE